MQLKLLDLENYSKGLKPVSTTELLTREGDFHPDGLFSEIIFGVEGSLDRSKNFSFINLTFDIGVRSVIYNVSPILVNQLFRWFFIHPGKTFIHPLNIALRVCNHYGVICFAGND